MDNETIMDCYKQYIRQKLNITGNREVDWFDVMSLTSELEAEIKELKNEIIHLTTSVR